MKNKLPFKKLKSIGRTTYLVEVPEKEVENESMGCTLRTGGWRAFAGDTNKEQRTAGRNSRIQRKAQRCKVESLALSGNDHG